MLSIQDLNKAYQDWKKASRAFSRTNSKLKDQPHLVNDKDFCIKLSKLEQNLKFAIETYKKIKSEFGLI